jgi:hypothetical protein
MFFSISPFVIPAKAEIQYPRDSAKTGVFVDVRKEEAEKRTFKGQSHRRLADASLV